MRHHPPAFEDSRGFECPDFVPHPDDDTSCTFGGMGCQYWIRDPKCQHPHWERHYVHGDERCPCGTTYPGAAPGTIVEYDSSSTD